MYLPSMYLSVQHAARRLGVSTHTIRRWTASGFLPCTRTAGGHRRIKQEDIEELATLIGGSNHLAARLARERELETLVKTAIAVTSQLDLADLLREVARQMTSLLDCHFCVISDYDRESRTVTVLADYDDLGNRRPDSWIYNVNQFPMAKRALEEHETVVVNVSDPRADPAEVAIMRRDGDKCLLVLPMVHRGQAIGLLEVLDHSRERRFTRQEMRLATAIAGQAAVALHNAHVFAQLRRSDQDVLDLRRAVEAVSAAHGALHARSSPADLLHETATLAADALHALSCVASWGDESAGASGAAASASRAIETKPAHVLVASAPCRDRPLTLTLTLAGASTEGRSELLTLIATIAAGALDCLLARREADSA
ncbi:MAG TPA: GAF domain-containing protein [Thermoleophilia bacterium]|nr:GAF domain-containing protein [Thermoleophilia bacterium]